jgi:hypothetical protein
LREAGGEGGKVGISKVKEATMGNHGVGRAMGRMAEMALKILAIIPALFVKGSYSIWHRRP